MTEQVIIRTNGTERVVLDLADREHGQLLVLVEPWFIGLVKEALGDDGIELKLEEIKHSGIHEVLLRLKPPRI